MAVDIKEKDKQEIKEAKKTRKSFIPEELAVKYEKKPEGSKKGKVGGKGGRKQKPKDATKYSFGFPTIESRKKMTIIYKKLGFTDAKSYLLAMIEISEEDENLRKKLTEKSNLLKKK